MKQYFYNERTHRLHIKGYCSHTMSGGLIPMMKHLPLMGAALDCVDYARNMKTN